MASGTGERSFTWLRLSRVVVFNRMYTRVLGQSFFCDILVNTILVNLTVRMQDTYPKISMRYMPVIMSFSSSRRPPFFKMMTECPEISLNLRELRS